jgi:hypothetical protein
VRHGTTLPLLASREEPHMHRHRFSVGEFVAFTEKRFPGLVWAAEWEVVDVVAPSRERRT